MCVCVCVCVWACASESARVCTWRHRVYTSASHLLWRNLKQLFVWPLLDVHRSQSEIFWKTFQWVANISNIGAFSGKSFLGKIQSGSLRPWLLHGCFVERECTCPPLLSRTWPASPVTLGPWPRGSVFPRKFSVWVFPTTLSSLLSL